MKVIILRGLPGAGNTGRTITEEVETGLHPYVWLLFAIEIPDESDGGDD